MQNVVFVEIRNLKDPKTLSRKRSFFLFIVPNVILSLSCQMMMIIMSGEKPKLIIEKKEKPKEAP